MMSSFRLRGICLQASTCLASVVLYTLSHPAADEPNGVTIAEGFEKAGEPFHLPPLLCQWWHGILC